MEVGRQEFGGHACTIYKVTFEQNVHGDASVNEDNVAAFVWIAKELGDCPVRINVINIAGQTNMTLLLTDIDLKAPAAELFEPPKDFIKYENMGTLMKRVMENSSSRIGQPEKSPEEGVRAEAEKGNAKAQFLLGSNYGSGLSGFKKDEAEAVKWYRKAADQGLADAQAALGVMYSIGRGIPKDEVEAYKWMLLAVEQGSVDFAGGNLEMLARHLTPAQRAEGERMVRDFKAKKAAPPKNP